MPQITTKEASQILGISKRTLFRWEQEGRIKTAREGILNVRVYNREYIVMVKKLLDLDKQIDQHNAKFPELLEQTKKHHLIQDYIPGKPLKLSTPEEVEAAIKASNDEETWEAEHDRQMTELGQLVQSFRTQFPDAPLKELFLKEERSK